VEPVLAEYVASKVVEDIRAERPLSSELCEVFIRRFRMIDLMRKHAKPSDFPKLRRLCDSGDDALCDFGLTLLFSIMSQDEVHRYAEDLFQRPNLAFRTRMILQFRFLDDPDLDRHLHEEFLQFMLDNWAQVLNEVPQWFGGRQGVADFCSQRLQDSRFPKTKRWAYVCFAAASDNPAEARQLIESYADDQDPFLREAVQQVLSRL